MLFFDRERFCERCNKKVMARLVRNIAQNGISQIYWHCIMGKHSLTRSGSNFIVHEKIKTAGINPDDLPIINNYSGRETCAVCGSPFAELHHWAPRYLFGAEADKWPTAYLCKKHHDLWHSLVTPNMTEQGKHEYLQSSIRT